MSQPAPPLPRPAAIGLGVLTVVLVGALSLVLFRDDIEAGDDEATPIPTVVPVGDDFERADADGLATDAVAWDELLGSWIVQDGHAALATPADDGAAAAGLAVLPRERAGGTVRATALAVEPGWGLAFRVGGPDDWWAAVAGVDEWTIVSTSDGTLRGLGVVPVAPRDGAEVAVELVGDLVRVTVDDQSVEVTDPTGRDAADVGLVATNSENLASMAWDGLTVTG